MNIVQRVKKHPYYTAAIAITLVGGGWYWYSHRTVATITQYVTATVEKQTIISTVSGSGQVSTLKRLDLKPQTSGTTNQVTLTSMNVVPGQIVKAGQVIAVIDNTSAMVSLEQAQASLISAEANYKKILGGTTETDLKNARQDVISAESALQNAKTSLDTVTQQQNTAVANSYRSLLTSGIAATQSLWSYTSTNVTESDKPTITGSYALTASGTLQIFQQGAYFYASGIETIPMQKIDTRIPVALGTTGLYVQFPNDAISAEWDIQIPNPQASSYVSNLISYQSALLSQKQALSNAQNAIITAQTNLQKAQDNLALKEQPPEDSSVATARAQLINAQSQLRTAQSNYSNTRITAPFAGQIAAVNSQQGDQVSGSTVIATLITEQKIVTVSLNEVDAAKVKVGNPVTLTFDAIPSLTLTGKVSQIDLLGTVAQGVVNYSVQISFDTQDDRVRPSMSAAAAIITETKTDVLAVPISAIKSNGSGSYVDVIEDSNIATKNGTTVTLKTSPKQQTVQVGASDNSFTEIISGLTEGETIVSRTITQAAAASSASSLRIPGITGGGGGNFRGN
ncbi:MAG: HlyD family efflux transporter periplasmic adaptor subunit [Patescibacteria group bacterium]|jgi:RND family efflux transporter MFP subunit